MRLASSETGGKKYQKKNVNPISVPMPSMYSLVEASEYEPLLRIVNTLYVALRSTEKDGLIK